MDKGFIRVRPLEGGFDAWAKAGLPLEGVPVVAVRGAGVAAGADQTA